MNVFPRPLYRNQKRNKMKYTLTIILSTFFISMSLAKEIKTEILIKAKPEKVWAILIDFQNYPSWNPFIKSINGEAILGKKITARIEPPGAKGMTFKPKILSLVINKELSWIGHFLFSGLFDGKHKFEIIDNGDGTTTFKQSEIFKGILVPFFKKMIEDNTKKGFEAMNQKLKELAEIN
jgi:hypothetical protein